MFLLSVVFAVLKLGAPFTDGAVLQRDCPVPVWGEADAGAKVAVSFAGQTAFAVAGTNGAWRVTLDPMTASREGRTLTVTVASAIEQSNNPNNQTILHDILVGEVWLASGQSNMQLPVWGGNPHFRDRQGALACATTYRPLVRFLTTGRANWTAAKPQSAYLGKGYVAKWRDFRPENTRDANFSAVAFFFAYQLFDAIQVPVGIIDSHCGGTRIEPWTNPAGFRSVPGLEKLADEAEALAEDPKFTEPSAIYNAMIAPFAPYALRGALWYQGCSNGEDELYCQKMHALYNGWAEAFENRDLSFYYVQLCCNGAVEVQLEQARFEFEEPHAAMAVINDLNNTTDIHPNEKELVARRLLVHALKRDYGVMTGEDSSPIPAEISVVDTNGTVRISLDRAEGIYLYTRDFHTMPQWFEVRGATGGFVKADILNCNGGSKRYQEPGKKVYVGGQFKTLDDKWVAKISDIYISAPGVTDPKEVRYWHPSVRPVEDNSGIYNQMSLPLGMFVKPIPYRRER